MNSEKVRFGSPEYKKLSTEQRLAVLEVVEAILASKKEAEAQPKQEGQDIVPLLENAETREAIFICFRIIGSQTKK